jgi:hypothetical protein
MGSSSLQTMVKLRLQPNDVSNAWWTNNLNHVIQALKKIVWQAVTSSQGLTQSASGSGGGGGGGGHRNKTGVRGAGGPREGCLFFFGY